MTGGFRIYISRDKREGAEPEHLHMWLDEPRAITQGRQMKIWSARHRLGIIAIEAMAGLGRGFQIKPGECKPVMLVAQ